MTNLNIRNLDPDLLAAVKVQAATERKTIRDFVINILERHVSYTKKEGDSHEKK